MPELPEVETIKRGLLPHVKNTIITNVVVRQPSLRWAVPKNLKTILSSGSIIDIQRRAKYLLFIIGIGIGSTKINYSPTGILVIHLGMSGKLQLVDKDIAILKHDHVDIILNNNTIIRYNDPRRFGAILWMQNKQTFMSIKDILLELNTHERFSHLGPEPLTVSSRQVCLL